MKARLGVAFVLAVTLAGTATGPARATASPSWPQFGYAATHNGFNPGEHILTRTNVPQLSLLWQRPLGPAAIDGTPVVSDGRVFVATGESGLSALSARDGSVLWTADVGLPHASTLTPAVSGGFVVAVGGLTSAGGVVAAFDNHTGQLRWKMPIPGSVGFSTPVAYGGRIFVTSGRTFYSLSATTGAVLWSSTLAGDPDNAIQEPVAVSDGGRYIIGVTWDGCVYAVRGSNGELVWRSSFSADEHSGAVAISGGIGYVTEYQEASGSRVYAFQVSTGRVVWSQPSGTDVVWVTPTVGNGVVFVGSWDFHMRAYDARTGAVRWVVPVSDEVWSSAALANGVLYSATESSFFALDARTGRQLFSTSLGTRSSPAVAGGRVYIGSGDQGVSAFGLVH
jgi:outer membrane protein assembly factor BamB